MDTDMEIDMHTDTDTDIDADKDTDIDTNHDCNGMRHHFLQYMSIAWIHIYQQLECC